MTMRVLKNNAGRIIEAQSGAGDLEVLVQNAIASGLRRADVTAVVMTIEQFRVELAAQRDSEKSDLQRRAESYPPVQAQLDAIWEGGEAESAMRERIRAIRRQYSGEARNVGS
jgi:TPP-dependent trihydroxycyclohexane-1,2-dione (THcHDO) dehydratase